MKQLRISTLMAVVTLSMMLGALALAVDDRDGKDKGRSLRAELKGIEEPPVILTEASGSFRGTISDDETQIDYELIYENLQGTVTQSHIHVAQRLVNGGISVWLCGTDTLPGPAGTPRCPSPNSGTVTGRLTAANVIGPAGQGVAAGEFAELLRAMRQGLTYANVHSSLAPGGEIRGQIQVKNGEGHDRDDD